MSKLNKKGAEKIFSIWWFFIITVIATTTVIAVLLFYSAEVDVKEVEAQVLAERVLSCLNQNGVLDSSFLDSNFNIIERCSLNKDVFAAGSDFLFEVSAYDESSKLIKTLSIGNGGFKADCMVLESQKIKAERYPKCISKEEKILFFDKGVLKSGKISILAASNQASKRIAVAVQ